MDFNIYLKTIRRRRKVSAGYTLIEILLVIAIILTVGFLSTSFPARLIHHSEIMDAFEELSGALEKARFYAISGKKNSAWGVHYGNSAITLFKGDSYSGRDRSFDEVTGINRHISVSGFNEMVFIRPGGRPEEEIAGATLSWSNENIGFLLNKEGIIE